MTPLLEVLWEDLKKNIIVNFCTCAMVLGLIKVEFSLYIAVFSSHIFPLT